MNLDEGMRGVGQARAGSRETGVSQQGKAHRRRGRSRREMSAPSSNFAASLKLLWEKLSLKKKEHRLMDRWIIT